MPSPFPCSPVNCEWSWKKTQIEKKYIFSGDIYLSFGNSFSDPIFSVSLYSVFRLFYDKVFKIFVILSAILLPIKSGVPSTVLWIALFEAVLSASATDYFAWSRHFWLHLLLKFVPMFLMIFFFTYVLTSHAALKFIKRYLSKVN